MQHTYLQVCSRLDRGKVVGEGVHGGAVLQQLVQHKVQQGGLAVCALHICQLQQRVQLEPCNKGLLGHALLTTRLYGLCSSRPPASAANSA